MARTHHVTALVLSRDGAQWLPRTLAGIAGQERPADRRDRDRRRLRRRQRGAPRGGTRVLVDGAGAGRCPGRRRRTGRQGRPDPAPAAAADPPELADAAGAAPTGPSPGTGSSTTTPRPEPGCLPGALLRGADRNPAAAVLVPKTVAWSDPGRLVGVGSRWAPGTPVVDPLEPNERDQGQYDVDRPVYAGDSAGMLVRADAWHAPRRDGPGGRATGPARPTCAGGCGPAAREVTFVPAAVAGPSPGRPPRGADQPAACATPGARPGPGSSSSS